MAFVAALPVQNYPCDHDVLLDEEFLQQYQKEDADRQNSTGPKLGHVHCLQDSSVTPDFTFDEGPSQSESRCQRKDI